MEVGSSLSTAGRLALPKKSLALTPPNEVEPPFLSLKKKHHQEHPLRRSQLSLRSPW